MLPEVAPISYPIGVEGPVRFRDEFAEVTARWICAVFDTQSVKVACCRFG
jgi:hypothetical protein